MRKLFATAKGITPPENERLELYFLLVYNRFEEFIETSLPSLSQYLGDELEPLVREFMRLKHTSPLLLDLGNEFVDFFRGKELPLKAKLPFLEELALYEWLEVELFNAPDERLSEGFSWKGSYRLSSSAKILHFSFPVHRFNSMSYEEMIAAKGNYYLLMYRDRDENVKSVELTEFVYGYLKEVVGGVSPKTALERRELEFELEEVIPYLENFMSRLVSVGVLVKM